MSNYEALRLEAETLSGLMMQLAENEIDSDSFAVMSDLGENGQEHDCDLPITETALRVSAVIDQLLAAMEEANSKNYLADMLEWRKKAEAAEQREDNYRQRWVDAVADMDVAGKRIAELEQRLQQHIVKPVNNIARIGDNRYTWNQRDLMWIEAIKAAGFKVEGE